MSNALVKQPDLMKFVPADKAKPIPSDDSIALVPVGGPFGDVAMTYSQFMGVVRSALKSRIGKQLDKALQAYEARQQAAHAADVK